MEIILKIMSIILIIVLVGTQLVLASPYRFKLTDDSLNGRVIKPYETLIFSGSILFGSLGTYIPNSCSILINGERYMTVDAFPVELQVHDGDVVEILLNLDMPSFYVYLREIKGQITTDLKESTVLINHGINRVLKVLPPR
jgi:hypothetical protein